jgi:acyl carrier protein
MTIDKGAELQNERAIKQFIVEEFLPDVDIDGLAGDYDLIVGGVIDSLGLLKVIAWLENRFDIAADDVELAPENFRSVEAIAEFVSATTTAGRR